MKRCVRWLVPALVGATTLLLMVASGAATTTATGKPTADRLLLFSSDGMRPDLMQRYANEGAMPTYAQLMRQGVIGANGLEQAFPPNTGVGWYTLMTGTWPSEHGSTKDRKSVV